MKTRLNIAKKAVASLMLGGLLFISSSWAQSPPCPSATPDNSGVGWTAGTPCMDMNLQNSDGTYCYYNVCWCYRYIASSNTFDYTISSITMESSCPEQGFIPSLSNVSQEAMQKLFILDPAYAVYSSHIPPCGSGSVLLKRIDLVSCWEVDPVPGGGFIAYPCTFTGWCIQQDNVCMADGYPVYSGTNKYTIVGTCSCNTITCE